MHRTSMFMVAQNYLEILLIMSLQRLNDPTNTAQYTFETQFPCYKEVFYKTEMTNKSMGQSVIFDMDMSPGDIITLFYLLKTPRTIIDLKVRLPF